MGNPPVAEGVPNATRSLDAPGDIEVIVGTVGPPAITEELLDQVPKVRGAAPVRGAT